MVVNVDGSCEGADSAKRIDCWLDALFFFSSRRRHTRLVSDWSSDVCSSDLSRERPKTRPGTAAKNHRLNSHAGYSKPRFSCGEERLEHLCPYRVHRDFAHRRLGSAALRCARMIDDMAARALEWHQQPARRVA